MKRERGRLTCAHISLGEAEEIDREGLITMKGPIVRANDLLNVRCPVEGRWQVNIPWSRWPFSVSLRVVRQMWSRYLT